MRTTGILLGAVLFTMIFAVQVVATEYVVDKSKSTVKWNGKKVTGEHYGTVDIKSGSLQVENNVVQSGTIIMDMTTITDEDISSDAMNKKLVGHLKSDDFFSVDKFPDSKLDLKKIVHKSGFDYSFTGDLTIKGITHPIVFDATMDLKDGKLSAKGEVVVDRTLYDIKFRSGKFFSNLGDNLIYDTFTLNFDVVANASGEANLISE